MQTAYAVAHYCTSLPGVHVSSDLAHQSDAPEKEYRLLISCTGFDMSAP